MSTVNTVGKIVARCLSQQVRAGLEQHLTHFQYGGEERFWSIGSSKDGLSETADVIIKDNIIDRSLLPGYKEPHDQYGGLTLGVYISPPEEPIRKELAEILFKATKEIFLEYLRLVVEISKSAHKDLTKEDIMEEAAEKLEKIIFRLFL